MPDWKQYEGELLDGKYPLERYAGGDDASGLFLIGFASTAVRIYRADGLRAATLIERWNRVKLLRHSHLLEIDATGLSTLQDGPVAYIVMEHAEENLGEILADRPLTDIEAREMLVQVAGTLADLHRQGLAHGEVRASNILAIGDSVKLTSDSVREGDAAADLRALGLTLIHALTQRTDPETKLPAPFGAIARGCLDPDPARRWTAGRVVAALRAPAVAKAPARRYAIPAGLAVAGLAVVALLAVRRQEAGAAPTVEPRPASAAVASSTPTPAPVRTAPTPTPAPVTRQPVPSDPERSSRDRLAMEDGIAKRVEPKVPEQARRTLDGRPVVAVRVAVNPAGDVQKAEVERTFSPYFGQLALNAARQWKFAPQEAADAREWVLRFQFSQKGTQITARRTRHE
jgi:TonB family protein